MNQPNHPLSEFTSAVMNGLNTLVDVNTIIGEPITTPGGVVIIPVSKVSFGYGSGATDLPTNRPDLFGGGSGGGVTIQPLAFLVVDGNDVKLLQMQTADNTNDRIVNAVPGVLDKILDLIPKKEKEGPTAAHGPEPVE
ncbi:sporulation protein YtfJ [Ruminococcaceae bacterium OttesenSCG-928-L11]|nr:sporulation protein YtfJ [Ruminococcaceae bacterium OttesenSCG-928-L11]